MILTSFLFVAMTGIVRHLGSDMPAMEAAFIRYFLGCLLIAPLFFKNRPKKFEPGILKLYGIRGFVHGIGVILWFYAMARIPIAEVTAIGYVAPIFVTLGAAIFLGEKLRIRRIMGVGCGFVGALIILRPGFQDVNLGQLAQLCATPLFACSFLIAKRLTDTQNPSFIVGMLSIGCTITLLPGAIYQWRTPTAEEIGWLSLTAVFATIGHVTLTKAFQAAPITVTQPLGFLQLVWAALLGILVFNEALDPFVFAGGGLIIAATTYISHREMQASRDTARLEKARLSEL
ncbi:DMT family transporter [Sneathiella aquimaris]|uniref:DMT family transporter n=1 Tax=Sneathiella aquimaris TaxID=2599305 RepID=UPI00146A6035|nr:DMT family transporter [Sneathiella aquimaris]